MIIDKKYSKNKLKLDIHKVGIKMPKNGNNNNKHSKSCTLMLLSMVAIAILFTINEHCTLNEAMKRYNDTQYGHNNTVREKNILQQKYDDILYRLNEMSNESGKLKLLNNNTKNESQKLQQAFENIQN